VSSVSIVAFGALSALGEGVDAVRGGPCGEPARVAIAHDAELARAGLRRPFAARVALDDRADRATALLERAVAACARELTSSRPGWRRERLGLILGTSAGAMRTAESAFEVVAGGGRPSEPRALTYGAPAEHIAHKLGVVFDPALLVLGACASASLAIGLAMRYLQRGSCDLVLAGGFDEVTVFVAAGFESLRATTASPPPRPFRVGRDGMALGEGAAVLALARDASRRATTFVSGFCAASDAAHLTAPHSEGAGLRRAAKGALAEAGLTGVDLVGAHATATPLNDAAEFHALAAALGPARARDVVIHPFKAQIGHTMGAAGALELLACVDAIGERVLPAAAGAGTLDVETPVHLLERAVAGAPQTALKLASAFGGANAALVVTCRPHDDSRALRPVFVCASAYVAGEPPLATLADLVGLPIERVARCDRLAALALAATARLRLECGSLASAGVVVGTVLATIETNAAFSNRIRERGAAAAEPRRFPYTSPNAAAGECSIAFGLDGPSFSVGGGPHAALEALAAAAVLVESGDADSMVVVAADDLGPAALALGLAIDEARSGALAVLLSARGDRADARARVEDTMLQRGASVVASQGWGHRALLPLLASDVPRELVCSSPPDFLARVRLAPV
jgi:3-oxoacyl-[acyl-carrier-protein] synthase-1/3-oxoacyl-[acyl-carrier-protein] synthase II